jgi:hypothetical protein
VCWEFDGGLEVVGGEGGVLGGPVRLGGKGGRVQSIEVDADLEASSINDPPLLLVSAGNWTIAECAVSASQRDALSVSPGAAAVVDGCAVGGLGGGIMQCKSCVSIAPGGEAALRRTSMSDGAVGLHVRGGHVACHLCTAQRNAVGVSVGGGEARVELERCTVSASRIAAYRSVPFLPPPLPSLLSLF